MTHKTIKRNDRGWRVGEDHPTSKVPDAVVVRARDLYEYEHMTPVEIARKLGVEMGLAAPPYETVKNWVYFRTRNVTPDYG